MVYIINRNGESLLPTTRFGKVRRLLNEKKAKIVKRDPFTIQLLYDIDINKENFIMDNKSNKPLINLNDNISFTGNTVIAGCSGSGRTTLLQAINKQLSENSNIDITYISYKKYLVAYESDIKAVDACAETISKFKDELVERLKVLGKANVKNYLAYTESVLPYKVLVIDDYNLFMDSNNYRGIDIIKNTMHYIGGMGNSAGFNFIISVNRCSGSTISTALMNNIFNKILLGPNNDDGQMYLTFALDNGKPIPAHHYIYGNKQTLHKSDLKIYPVKHIPYYTDFIEDINDDTEVDESQYIETSVADLDYNNPLVISLGKFCIKDNILIIGKPNSGKSRLISIFEQQLKAKGVEVTRINGLDEVINNPIPDASELIGNILEKAKNRFKGSTDNNPIALLIDDFDVYKDNITLLPNVFELLLRLSFNSNILIILSCTTYESNMLPGSQKEYIDNHIILGPTDKEKYPKYNFKNDIQCSSGSGIIVSNIKQDDFGTVNTFDINLIPGNVAYTALSEEEMKNRLSNLLKPFNTLIYGSQIDTVSEVLDIIYNSHNPNLNNLIYVDGSFMKVKSNINSINDLVVIDPTNQFTILPQSLIDILQFVYDTIIYRLKLMENSAVKHYSELNIDEKPLSLFINNYNILHELVEISGYKYSEALKTLVSFILRYGYTVNIKVYISYSSLNMFVDLVKSIKSFIANKIYVGPTQLNDYNLIFNNKFIEQVPADSANYFYKDYPAMPFKIDKLVEYLK